jgi:hypothetical protein
MEIGSVIQWRGRMYVLVGVDPTNVPERRAYLRERAAAETFEAPFAELESVDEAEPDDVSRSGH